MKCSLWLTLSAVAAAAGIFTIGFPRWGEEEVIASALPEARLLNAMGDLQGNNGVRARDALTKRGASVVPALIARLRHPDPQTRAAAAIVLGNIADRRAVGPLSAALGDVDERVRFRAAYALGRLKDPAAVPSLAPLLADRSPHVRNVTVRALEECRCKVRLSASRSGYQILPQGTTEWQSIATEAHVAEQR